MIARCCRLKADVVENDEREETGLRAVLNYGHTFAHAFETLSGYGKLLHGEAVAIGMICAARLAERLGRVDAAMVAAAAGTAAKLRPADADAEARPRKDPGRHDARQEGRSTAGLRFVLPSRLGHVELVERHRAGRPRAR